MNKNIVTTFISDTIQVLKREFRLALTDKGALVFIVVLPLLYPVAYSLVYNPELAREVPIAVIDDCHTATTRKYARALDASENVKIISYAANMQEAQRLMHEKKCYAIFHFPSDFSRNLGRKEQAVVKVYCDMSVFLRYKSVLMASNAVMLELSSDARIEAVPELSAISGGISMPVSFKLNPLGNTAMGMASAMLPGILILIFQQAFILAIHIIFATSRDRARRNNGIDPLGLNVGIIPLMLGKTIAFLCIMIVPFIYLTRFIPVWFCFPQNENLFDLFIFGFPFMLSVIFLGFIFQAVIRERETVFPVVVFSSLFFIFLSGVSWPRYAMGDFWIMIGNILPSTWAIEGYVAMCSMGASLAQQSHSFTMLWILACCYAVIAYVVLRAQRAKN